MKSGKFILKIIVLLTYILMIGANVLANVLPINGITTGEVSDSYLNLFAPAGLTFAIWGVIYILLAIYTIYQLIAYKSEGYQENAEIFKVVGLWFAISSIANTIWIFAWHYDNIPLTMGLMVVILICLMIINVFLRNKRLTLAEKFMVRLPFSVYFGWITVATIANATTLLVSLGWDRAGFSESLVTIFILLVGVLIGLLTIYFNRDIAYGLVIIWAYAGILLKHLSTDGFDREFPLIIITVAVCIVLLIAAEIYQIFFRRQALR